MCLSTVLFYPPNKYSFHYFPSLLESFFCEAEWPGPLSLTTGLVVGIQCSHQCYPASISGWETKASLQDAAGSGHPRLHWLRLNFQRRGVDLIPGRRTKIPHAAAKTWHSQISKSFFEKKIRALMLGLGSSLSSGALALSKSLLSLGLFLTLQNEEKFWVTHSPRHCGRLCPSEGAIGISSSPLQTGLPSRKGSQGSPSSSVFPSHEPR